MRTYSRDEVKALLERAVELQARAERERGDGEGLTLQELEEVASASGIDPDVLRRAAAELDATDRTERTRTEASATHVHAERWIDVEMREEVWEEVVLELRHRYDTGTGAMMGMPTYGRGRIETIGRAREWIHVSTSGIETRAMLRTVGQGVHLSLRQRVGMTSPLGDAFIIGSFIAIIGFGAGFLVPGPGWMPVLTALLTLAAATAVVYPIDKMWRSRKQHQLSDLADRLVERCLDAAHRDEPRAATTAATTAATAAITGASSSRNSEARDQTSTPANGQHDTPDAEPLLDQEAPGEPGSEQSDEAAPSWAQTASRDRRSR